MYLAFLVSKYAFQPLQFTKQEVATHSVSLKKDVRYFAQCKVIYKIGITEHIAIKGRIMGPLLALV